MFVTILYNIAAKLLGLLIGNNQAYILRPNLILS